MKTKKGIDINEIVNETDTQKRNKLYNDYVEEVTPKHNIYVNIFRAFFVGGVICAIGQGLIALYTNMGAGKEDAQLYNILTLMLLSAIFTGLGIYAKIAKYGGAGAVVPITGFANSVVAPAVEFKKEGQVFGIGCKIFTIAGPVILYGVLSSWILGIIYWIYTLVSK